MHLYIATRGIKHDVDRFVNDMQAQYLRDPTRDTKEGPAWIQLAMRPIQLWEIVFPKESLQLVLKTIWRDDEDAGSRRKTFGSLKTAMLRKALRAKPIPKLDPKELRRIVYNPSTVSCYPIGIKEDKEVDDQEAL